MIDLDHMVNGEKPVNNFTVYDWSFQSHIFNDKKQCNSSFILNIFEVTTFISNGRLYSRIWSVESFVFYD